MEVFQGAVEARPGAVYGQMLTLEPCTVLYTVQCTVGVELTLWPHGTVRMKSPLSHEILPWNREG